ncbi:hypothetical protein [Bacillus sp. MRMR6]|uniref:hypothetical protein n=1 Tax=Bacillus sp. MRMR6 TaxID=1928617 RepID=UPI00095298BA|nr:hypothetical protein [Bacillus sp. MRMR6]OLS33748.1 hypothetical protein BTR25_24280 [Bacillus sp. MRMR6]
MFLSNAKKSIQFSRKNIHVAFGKLFFYFNIYKTMFKEVLFIAKRKWSKEEDQYLLNNLDKKTRRVIAAELNRSYDAINARVQKHFPSNEIGGIWTKERVEYLKKHGNTKSAAELADYMNMKLSTVYKKLRQLGLDYWVATGERWEDIELQYLIDNYNKKSYYEIGRYLGKTKSAVEQKARNERLEKSRNFSPWSNEELQILKKSIEEGKHYEEIGNLIDRTHAAIIRKAHDLGLVDSKDFIYTKLNKEKELFIIENASTMTDLELAQLLNISEKGVAEARKRNGIFKHGGLHRAESNLQCTVKDLLVKEKYDFVYNQPFGEFIPDFINHDKKVVIEVNGDYWHCNPTVYKKPKDDKQIRHILTDHSKKCFYLSNGYLLIILWEYDLIHNNDIVVKKLNSLLNAVFNGTINNNQRAKALESYNWCQYK